MTDPNRVNPTCQGPRKNFHSRADAREGRYKEVARLNSCMVALTMEIRMADFRVVLVAPGGEQMELTIKALHGEIGILEKDDGPHLVLDNTDKHVPRPPEYVITLEATILRDEKTGIAYEMRDVSA